MWYDSVLDFLRFGPARTRAGRTRSVVPRKWRATCKLHLELLEDRTLPSTLTVLNTHDNGDGSLRAVLAAAQPDDTIRFDHHLRGQTITLTSGELVIDKSLDIEGLGANRLTVSGNDASRVFEIAGGVTVEIDDLTIAHGRADNGGGIWNAGGTLTLSHDVIADNQALGAPGSGARGGGVFNQGGTLTVDHSTFSDNQGIGGAGDPGVLGSNGAGGGLWNGRGSTLLVTNSTFTGNQALGGAGGSGQVGGNGNGGGLQQNSSLDGIVAFSRFTDNQAIGGPGGAGGDGGAGDGGGLLNSVPTGATALTVSDCSVRGNQAIGGAGGAG